jgi:hypothetical protein
MAIRQPLSTGTSESSIIFYNGGHNHDGISSALISTAKYSIYDFTTDFIGTDSRQSVQSENFRKFKNVIADIVKTDVLTTAGITLTPNQVRAENISAGAVTATQIAANTITANQIAANTITATQIAANTITANQIAAGAITADELAANIVLVNNVISSSNFSPGVSGWAINSNGTAEFANTSIRGTIAANSVTTPGIDIDSSGNLTSNASTFGIYANGAIFTSSGNFSVDASGNLSANNAQIRGEISSNTFVTHTNFAGSGSWTNPTVLIDSSNNRLELNSTNGGLRITADSVQRYSSGDSFYSINWDFNAGLYNFLGIITVDEIGTDTLGVRLINASGSITVDSTQTVSVGSSYLSSGQISSAGTITAATSVGVTSGTNSVVIEAGTIDIKKTGGGSAPIYINRAKESSGGGRNYCVFALGVAEFGGLVVGSITQNAGNTITYNTTSDSRLKNNVDKPYDALAVTNLLMPRTYKMLLTSEDEKDDEYFGFFAQELYEVYPQAVSPGIDASEQNIDLVKMDPWSIDYSKLTPLLTKAIQELCIKVEVLEQKVVELESN